MRQTTATMGAHMTPCSMENLVHLLCDQLNLDDKLAVLEHLDECKVCREIVFRMSRERDGDFFVRRPYNIEKLAGLA
jgi:hypothetical protein